MPRTAPDGPSAAEIGERIRKTLANLETALSADVLQARILVAELYGKIDVFADGENVWTEYDNAAEKLLIASSGMSLKLVAGGGICPLSTLPNQLINSWKGQLVACSSPLWGYQNSHLAYLLSVRVKRSSSCTSHSKLQIARQRSSPSSNAPTSSQ